MILKHLLVEITLASTYPGDTYRDIHLEVTTEGNRYTNVERIFADDFESVFERIFDRAKREILEVIENDKKTVRSGG